MDEFFASKPATNDSYLCVGPLTKSEAADVIDAGIGNGLALQLLFLRASESMGNHDSEIVDAGSVD